MTNKLSNENKNNEPPFYGRTRKGVYIYNSIILFTIAIIVIGEFFFDYWFFWVIIVAAFITADVYFEWLIDYESGYVKIPKLNRKTNNDYAILLVYFIGILISGLMADATSYLLTLFKPVIQNVLVGVPIISVIMTSLAVKQMKSYFHISKRCSQQ